MLSSVIGELQLSPLHPKLLVPLGKAQFADDWQLPEATQR
jgi:hypothetical protein